MLERQYIRSQVVSMLKGATNAGTHVYDNSVLPFADDSLCPYIQVVSANEDWQGNLHLSVYDSKFVLLTQIVVSNSQNPQDEIDIIAEQVKNVILKNNVFLIGLDILEMNMQIKLPEHTATPLMVGVMAWTFTFRNTDIQDSPGFQDFLDIEISVQTTGGMNTTMSIHPNA